MSKRKAPPLLRAIQSPAHDSSHTHVQGSSEFIDDRPPVAGELQVGLVVSARAHAEFTIDAAGALRLPGVFLFTAKDFPHNIWGTIFKDQPLLAEKEAQFVGEPLAVVAASSRQSLERAKRAVRVTYKERGAILSIAEAKKKKSFIGPERTITRGDFHGTYAGAPHHLEGTIRLQGQDHFYLESQACIVYPKERGQLEVHSSSQHPTEVQHVVAHALRIAESDVVCVVKRMGGAFGGKESQAAPFAAFAALVAQRTGRAARLVLTKDEDMVITGKRNPFENSYRVGFDNEGRILAIEARFFSDGGAYADLSTSIMERAMLHVDNAYFLPVARITGQVCRTNTHPHTAFRGFGGPQGVATIEGVMEDIARSLGVDALDVRKRNVYQEPDRNITHYGQPLENNLLPGLFDALEQKAKYRARRKQVEDFNHASKTHLKGLSLTAVKFGISFTTRFLNQGNALVNVHTDGTVQVSTGATEMGQGVNTRIAQVVAGCFGITHEHVRVMATSTEKNHNTSPTAASSGTDLNAKAALVAAERIKARLAQVAELILTLPKSRWATATAGLGTEAEYELRDEAGSGIRFAGGFVFAEKNPQNRITFGELARETYLHRISLGEYGFFKYPAIHFNKLTGQGSPFFYFTQGVACSEVLIDRFTGELKVSRVDILMDLGRPINYGLDMGQVTGGFVQGMGWVTTENLFYDEKGVLLSHSPSTYKIPSVQDTPRVFNVDFVDNSDNGKNIAGSKAVGEPPLLLAVSVWSAVKDAVSYGEKSRSIVPLPIPATLEQILMAMEKR